MDDYDDDEKLEELQHKLKTKDYDTTPNYGPGKVFMQTNDPMERLAIVVLTVVAGLFTAFTIGGAFIYIIYNLIIRI